MLQLPDCVVSAHWLKENLSRPELVVLDASWYLPTAGMDGYDIYCSKRIPDARFFDFDRKICQQDSDLPHMLPDEMQFAEQVSALGIASDSVLVIYDQQGLFSAPRAWWMFKVMGHKQVAVLDGGLPAWQAGGGTIDTESPAVAVPAEHDYVAELQAQYLAPLSDVLAAAQDSLGSQGVKRQVMDARPADRFHGKAPEPRPGLRSGHMPGAISVPFGELLEDGRFKARQDLEVLFQSAANTSDQLIASCGSGVTACVLALGAEYAGFGPVAVYDGSWAEWGGDDTLPVEAD